MSKTNYNATILGLIFTLSCWVLYYTFVFPFLIMLPLSLTLESIFSGVFKKQDYSSIGISVIISLFIIFLLVLIVFVRKFINQIKTNGTYKTTRFLLFLVLQLFIIHPLVFYINLSNDWSRARDGQFILSIDETFQLSSFSFVIFGIALDLFKFGLARNNSIGEH